MAQVENEIIIDGPIEQVFDAVTTTASWPHWHPATLAVGGVTDRPVQLGDQIRERARIGQQEYEGEWTVTEHQRPRALRMHVQGTTTEISYAFAEVEPGHTRFTRTLSYDEALFAGSAADPRALQQLMFSQSQQALVKLKVLVERSIDTSFAARYLGAWNRHAVDDILDFFAPEATYADMGLGASHTGHAALREFFADLERKFSSDYQFQPSFAAVNPDAYAMEWTMSGTHDRSGAMPATNKRFVLHGVSVGELRDGKIVRNADYWNMVEFLTQIGMLPAPAAAAAKSN